MNKALKEELELLRLESRALKLKLLISQASHRKNNSNIDNMLEMLDNIPGTASFALKAVSMPQKLSTKLLVGAALLGIAYIRYRTGTTNR